MAAPRLEFVIHFKVDGTETSIFADLARVPLFLPSGTLIAGGLAGNGLRASDVVQVFPNNGVISSFSIAKNVITANYSSPPPAANDHNWDVIVTLDQ